MTEKVTGRDRGDGATRKSVPQQIHADFPGNSASTQLPIPSDGFQRNLLCNHVGTYEGNDGSVRASLDMVADEIASTTPRPKKPRPAPAHREHQGGAAAGDPFADDVDWMGA